MFDVAASVTPRANNAANSVPRIIASDVVDRELVEADHARLRREPIRDEFERILAVAQRLEMLVHVGHEAMKVAAQLVVERQCAVEKIHQERFAASHAAPEVESAHLRVPRAEQPRDAAPPTARRLAGPA